MKTLKFVAVLVAAAVIAVFFKLDKGWAFAAGLIASMLYAGWVRE